MVLARAENAEGTRQIVMLGITAENVTRLKKGEPILVNERTHAGALPAGIEIAVFYGATEEAIVQMMQKEGVIGPDTVVTARSE